MKRNLVIYTYPFAIDIAVALLLFVGRHSLASQELGEGAVGSILLCYGLGYFASSLFMRRIVKPPWARGQMLAALLAIALSCCLLAQVRQLRLIQLLFCFIPLAVSLFINAFQAFMLDLSNQSARPLGATAGYYTASWSMGFALGPFASGAARSYCSWPQVYYLAAAIAGALALAVALFRPARTASAGRPQPRGPSPGAGGPRSLVGPAWLGVGLGWAGWNILSTYWPVQATQSGFPPSVKGGVEFAFALTQSLAALALAHAGPWHRRPWLLPLFGLAGLLGLLVFGAAATPAGFLAGAVLYGLFTSSAFSHMVYHSMCEEEKAVRRVALNETFVGLSFLAGPVVASLVHQEGTAFAPAYVLLGLLLAAGIAVQTLWARRLVAGAD